MLAGKQLLEMDVLTTDSDPTTRLRAVIGRLSRRLRPRWQALGLTPSQTSVLFTVVRLGPLGLSEISEIEGINPTMLSRITAQLCQSGLIGRESDPDDRRAALVRATPAGQRLRKRIHRERTEALQAAHGKAHRRAARAAVERAAGARDARRADPRRRARDASARSGTHHLQGVRDPQLPPLYAGQAISLSGTWMQMAAQAWLVLTLTGSATTLGLIVALQTLPILLLGPYGGVIADRVDKRRLMICLQA